jgi:hypothetical protein
MMSRKFWEIFEGEAVAALFKKNYNWHSQTTAMSIMAAFLRPLARQQAAQISSLTRSFSTLPNTGEDSQSGGGMH